MAGSLASLRQEKIREYIEKREIATIRELQELCPEVSLMTIHRDLDALEEEGLITKFRGGAKRVQQTSDPVFDVRLRENQKGKTAIAKKALSLIRPGGSVFLDASTTNLILASLLPDVSLSVVTTSPSIALELSKLSNPTITLCCGTLHRRNLALAGQNTLDMLRGVNIDVAFVGVSGCSADAGFTCGTEDDMRVKRMVIEKARQSVILCDHTKFDRLMPYTFGEIGDPDVLICDTALPEEIAKAAKKGKVKVL